jgi:hypothetical protein
MAEWAADPSQPWERLDFDHYPGKEDPQSLE